MNNVFLRFPGGRIMAVTLSYDDNVTDDVRLSETMRKYCLRGTFNINSAQFSPEGSVGDVGKHGHRRLTLRQSQELHREDGMEVACHGATHPFLEQLPPSLCVKEILEDRLTLEEHFGCMVRGLAYPFGTYSDSVIAAAKSCGIVYARTVASTHGFGLPSDWLRWDPTCHHIEPELMTLVTRFLEDKRKWRPRLFYLWGHAYEFTDSDNWYILEDFGKAIGCRDDVWYATNIEIYDYVNAYGQLVFSADGRRVYNPTLTELFIGTRVGEFGVKPGETIEIEI